VESGERSSHFHDLHIGGFAVVVASRDCGCKRLRTDFSGQRQTELHAAASRK